MLWGGALLLACSNIKPTCTNIKKGFKKIYGNDFDNNILKLAYINMLLHNDGITNLQKFDATSKYSDGESLYNTHSFAQWVKNLKINKVIANPPYEHSFAIDILENVLNNIEPNSKIIWLMPNTKMEKIKKSKNILLKNTLTDIIFLGDKLFPKIASFDVCLFLFESAKPQNNQKIKCWHLNDGFKTVKNQGYQDVDGVWLERKKNFLNNWKQGKFDFEIDPSQHLCYPKHFETTNVTKKDFEMTLLQYMLYKQGRISSQNTVNSTLQLLIDFMEINTIPKLNEINTTTWKEFKVSDLFVNKKNKRYSKISKTIGATPFVSSTSVNNGIVKYVDLEPNQLNAITVSTNGACFDCFWHDYDFCASTDVEILYPRFNITTNIALFICTCLAKWKGKYSYKNKPKNGIVWKTFIKLPIKNNQPDWEYMEKYMKNKN